MSVKRHNLFRSISNISKTPRNTINKESEEVYKLNFIHINDFSSKKKEKAFFPKIRLIGAIENKGLFNSIDKVKKFLPNKIKLTNISRSKKLEAMLFNRFEHQEYEKTIKNEIKIVSDKKLELKNIILKKIEELKKLDDNISDIELSTQVISDMNNSSLKNDNKRKLIHRFSNKELSTPEFNNILNKNNLYDNESINNNINNNFIKMLSTNIHHKGKRMTYIQNFDDNIFNINDNDDNNSNNKTDKNLSFGKMIFKNNVQILKLKKILSKNKIDRNKLSSEIKELEKEKEELKNKYEYLVDKLYLFYLDILKEGQDTRNEGLSWIIKEIIHLKRKVLLSYFPKYLDEYAIEYIFKQTKLNLVLEKYEKQIKILKKELADMGLVEKSKLDIKNIKIKLKNKNKEENKIEDKETIKKNINKSEDSVNNSKHKIRRDLSYNKLNIKIINLNGNNNINKNILNEYPKINSTYRTAFTNINNDSIYNNAEKSINNNINSPSNTSIKENINNDIYININDNTPPPNILNKFNTSLSSDKNKIISYELDKNCLKNKFISNINKNKKVKVSQKLLKIFKKNLDLSSIELIPNNLKVNEVKEFFDAKIPKINNENFGKIKEFFEVNQIIKSIKNKLKEMKDNEMKRIFEEYLRKGNQQKMLEEKETILSALIGQNNVLPELNKQMRESRIYFESIQKCGLTNQSFYKNKHMNQIKSILMENNMNINNSFT